ncbi:MAG: DUF523 domain-containing protein [Promethearchaeota archaeon]
MKEVKRPILVSACLLGIQCAYDGRGRIDPYVFAISTNETLIPICPEQLGGLSTPRPPAEIVNGTGADVLDGKASVVTINGEDTTINFLKGAEETVWIARLVGATSVILRPNSPSCGFDTIYDGSFSNHKINGDGVTTALLKREGIQIFNLKERNKIEDE